MGHYMNADVCPLNVSPSKGMQAARCHLNEGISMSAAAERFGITREAVRQAKVKLKRAAQQGAS
jgi:transposase-like protein